MSKKVPITRTTNPIHFEDLEPHRFEDLIRQIAYLYRNWGNIEATGRLGSDDGVDIRAIESIPTQTEQVDDDISLVEDRVWIIQCKRYQTVGPTLMRQIVSESIKKDNDLPYGLIIALACDVTKRTYDAFRQAARESGVQEFDLWVKARLEDLLFQPKYDSLLFTYFGLSISIRRKSRLADVRHQLAIKKKLEKILESNYGRINPTPLLIRDIEDENYPRNEDEKGIPNRIFQPWHVVRAERYLINGLLVSHQEKTGWVKEDGSWDIAEDCPNLLNGVLYYQVAPNLVPERPNYQKADEFKNQVPAEEQFDIYEAYALPFLNVLEIDSEGDNAYHIPQLFCSYIGKNGPYTQHVRYFYYKKEGGTDFLNPANRTALFK